MDTPHQPPPLDLGTGRQSSLAGFDNWNVGGQPPRSTCSNALAGQEVPLAIVLDPIRQIVPTHASAGHLSVSGVWLPLRGHSGLNLQLGFPGHLIQTKCKPSGFGGALESADEHTIFL